MIKNVFVLSFVLFSEIMRLSTLQFNQIQLVFVIDLDYYAESNDDKFNLFFSKINDIYQESDFYTEISILGYKTDDNVDKKIKFAIISQFYDDYDYICRKLKNICQHVDTQRFNSDISVCLNNVQWSTDRMCLKKIFIVGDISQNSDDKIYVLISKWGECVGAKVY